MVEINQVYVCCSVLHCVVVCCSVLQCTTVCCSVLQCAAVSAASAVGGGNQLGIHVMQCVV